MTYLWISITAYLINGISLIIDKQLVDHSLKSPFVYCFYIGILSFLVVILIPFGFNIPSTSAIIYSFFSGVLTLAALLVFFTSLRTFNLTVTSPLVGITNPVFTILIEVLFLNQYFTANQYTAFGLMILGTIILTFNLWWKRHAFNMKLALIFLSGFLFALSYITLSLAFANSSFVDAMVISRVTVTVCAAIFLLFPHIRKTIFATDISGHNFMTKTGILVLASQFIGALSGLMIAYAVSLANPALVNSLSGVQYIMLLAVALILSKKYPHILDENLHKKALIQKVAATALFAIGFIYLAK